MDNSVKMVKMINAVTGTEMWVARERVPEYRRAGHKQVGSLFGSSEPVATSHREEVPETKPEIVPEEKIPEKKPAQNVAAPKKAQIKAPAKRKK